MNNAFVFFTRKLNHQKQKAIVGLKNNYIMATWIKCSASHLIQHADFSTKLSPLSVTWSS